MRNLIFITAFIYTLVAGAQTLTTSQKQYNPPTNLLQNGSFQNGKSRWSNSGGTFAIVTSGSNLLFDSASATFDASAASQYLQSTLYVVPEGLKNAMCEGKIFYKGGDANYTLKVLDGSSNVIASRALESAATDARPFSVLFSCPSSGSIRLRLESTADGALVALSKTHLGEAHSSFSGSAKFYGRTQHFATGVTCAYTANNSPPFADLSIDNDCVITNAGNANTSVKQANISFPSLPAGDYHVIAFATPEVGSTVPTYCSWRLSDGTTHSPEERQTFISTLGEKRPITLTHNFSYNSQQGPTTFRIQGYRNGGSGSCDIFGTDSAVVFHVYQFPAAQEQAFRFDTYGWYIDAEIKSSSGHINLNTSDVSEAAPNNPNMTLTNLGSKQASITCSAGNPPTGTTCAAGNEQIGINFDIPSAQSVKVCAYFNEEIDAAALAQIYTTWHFIETANNSDTNIQTCGVVNGPGIDGGSPDRTDELFPVSGCVTCNFSTAGNKTIRLKQTTEVNGTINAHSVHAAVDGITTGRVKIIATPITQQVPAPLFLDVNTKINAGVMNMNHYFAEINCDGSSSVLRDPAGLISTISNNVGGQCNITLNSGKCTQAPFVTGNANSQGLIMRLTSSVGAISTVALTDAGGAPGSYDAFLSIGCQ